MLHVFPLSSDTESEFEKLFSEYYEELGCDDDIPHLLSEYVIPDLLSGLIKIDLLKDGEIFAGFVIYQIDDIDNEWNKKEGWGDIREIYVIPPLRGQGLGKFLLYTAEFKLKESGAEKCYSLPNDGAAEFFKACGYAESREYDEDMECFAYQKLNLNNKCK